MSAKVRIKSNNLYPKKDAQCVVEQKSRIESVSYSYLNPRPLNHFQFYKTFSSEKNGGYIELRRWDVQCLRWKIKEYELFMFFRLIQSEYVSNIFARYSKYAY